ncbi:ABC transporter substrate-binding protein [Pseudonocardia sp. TRM90224]|uniref:ABC transporter substrate-binding protein n=1 Tax=Pseudonocardia sp. TRM90224 TaxID=2812678 RepID=UPI001E290CFF|nr:ABC transporter substrate-binding protein [Pseudonocardia sp. TRM90224]
MPTFENFAEFPKLIETVRALYRRRRRRCTWRDTPPILGCVQPRLREDGGLLESISARLTSSNPRLHVPHARVELEPGGATSATADPDLTRLTHDDVGALATVLFTIADRLARANRGAYRFPRFWLACWLMEHEVAAGPHPVRMGELRRALYERAVRPATSAVAAADTASDGLPGWVRALGMFLTPVFFRVRQSGRVPLLGGIYRWFRRKQPYMAPGNDSFFELALRLSKKEWSHEEPDQVARLLVNAFLEDLTVPFLGRGWIRRYRTTFPIVLLDGITRRNGGYTLLRMIAAIRNDTRKFDPLLLITTSRRVPPLAEPPVPDPDSADPGRALRRWIVRMPEQSRRRDIVAWVATITIPEAATDDLAAVTAALEPLQRPPRPWLRTRRAGGLIAAALLLAAGGSYTGFGLLHSHEHCGDGFTWLGVEPTTSTIHRVGDTCVGVTDGSNPMLLQGNGFDVVRATVLAQNERALRVHEQQPDRPIMTLVFLAAVDTAAAPGEEALSAESEQLAGVAVAQAVQLAKPQDNEPLIRVLIANTGPGLQHGPEVAKQLGAMAKADPSIVAVTGLVESRASTATMIRELAAVGLPTVVANLTADPMESVSELYFQISPQNMREAAVAAEHVENLLETGTQPFGRPIERRAVVYRSADVEDVYSQNLAADFEAAFAKKGFQVRTVPFAPARPRSTGKDAGAAGREACDAAGGVVLYAARGPVDFQGFLNGVSERCRDDPPYILGGDDVTRYVANRPVSGANRSVPYQFLSLATGPEVQSEPPVESTDFYAALNDLFPEESVIRSRTLDGHAALNYDAAYTVVVAVRYLRDNHVQINGGTVWRALMSVTDAADARQSYRGVTGRIDFGGTVDRRVPVDKPVTIVTFRDGGPDARETIVCGPLTDPDTPQWCPADEAEGAN